MNEFEFIKKIAILEFLLLSFLSLIIFFIGIKTALGNRLREKKMKMLKIILDNMICQRVIFPKEFFPKILLHLNIIVPVLEEYSRRFNDPFWRLIKDKLIYEIMREELISFIEQKSKWLRIWTLRALILSPQKEFQKELISEMEKKFSFTHLLTLPYVLSISTKKMIREYIPNILKKNEAIQITFTHMLHEADEKILHYLKEIYEESNSKKIRLLCLKILCNKVGYLTKQTLTKDLEESNLENRWWAIRSLVNLPSKETTQILLDHLNSYHWQIRALCFLTLGKFNDPSTLPDLANGLGDKNNSVKVASIWAISNFKKEGEKILQDRADLWKEFTNIEQLNRIMPIKVFERHLDKISNYL